MSTTPATSPAEPRKITVALNARAAEAADYLQDSTGRNLTGVISTALLLYRFYDEEVTAGTKLVFRRDGVDEVIRLML